MLQQWLQLVPFGAEVRSGSMRMRTVLRCHTHVWWLQLLRLGNERLWRLRHMRKFLRQQLRYDQRHILRRRHDDSGFDDCTVNRSYARAKRSGRHNDLSWPCKSIRKSS